MAQRPKPGSPVSTCVGEPDFAAESVHSWCNDRTAHSGPAGTGCTGRGGKTDYAHLLPNTRLDINVSHCCLHQNLLTQDPF